MKITWLDRIHAQAPFTEPLKFPKYVYHKIAQELWREDYILNYGNVENPIARALVLEHVRPFYRPPTEYDPRPGRSSKIRNVEIMNELGIAVDIYDLSNTSVQPDDFDQYDLLFGSGSNFEEFSDKLRPDATKIYYTGGPHYEQLAEQYSDRLAGLRQRKNVDIQPGRPGLFDPDVTDTDRVDVILTMGDELVRKTYTDRVDIPVYSVPITHTPQLDFDINSRNYETARTKFLWFGGLGPALKGLDLVLDAFDGLPSLELYVVGPYEHHDEFVDVYRDQLYNSENIHTLGHVDIRSPLFERLVRECAYLVFPSASEGSSGSTAACMWRGMIPMITPEVREETDDWGITLPDDSVEGIRKKIRDCAEMPVEDVREMSRKAYEEAHQRYDRERYSETIQDILLDIFEKTETPHRHSVDSESSYQQ